MQGFFASPVVRAILAFAALILLALAVWFIGPLLAFGEMHPLASMGVRITTIGLMLVCVVFALMGWTLSVIGVICLCLLVWHAGPLLAFANIHPLETVWARAVTIAVIALVYLVWALYTLWNLIRSDEAFAKRLFGRDQNAPKALAKDEVRAIAESARKSVGQLRHMHSTMAGGAGSLWAALRRLVEGKRYLYELPWYMIIGTPGAGKTSALLNSGLKFPMAEQMGMASAQMTLSQNAGTLNCAWWFTNDAVLIDTAGRYTNPADGRGFKRLKPAGIVGSNSMSIDARMDAGNAAGPQLELFVLQHRGLETDFSWQWPAAVSQVTLADMLSAVAGVDAALLAQLQACSLQRLGGEQQAVWLLAHGSPELQCSVNAQVLAAGSQLRLAHGDEIELGLMRLLVALEPSQGISALPDWEPQHAKGPATDQETAGFALTDLDLLPGTLAKADVERQGLMRSDFGDLIALTPREPMLPMQHKPGVLEEREQIRALLRQVRQWIEHHEPSSPVTILIKQADRMWGKRFSEIASMIPPDLMQAWDRDD